MNRRLSLVIFPGLVLIILIFSDVIPWLRGPAPETSEWYWPYLLRPFSHWWLPAIVAILFLLAAAWWLRRPANTRRDLLALLALSSIMIGLQLALIYADRPAVLAELVDRTLSNLSSGYFQPAAAITDLNAALRNYPALMPEFAAEHARTHPPGLILANNRTVALFEHFPRLSLALARTVYSGRCTDLWLLERPYATAAALLIWSILPLLFAASTIWPGYALARQWLNPTAARLATLLTATIPALLLFAPKVIQFYPPLVLLLFWCLAHGLKTRRLRSFFLAGTLYSSLTFLSLGNLALALPIGLFMLLDLWRTQRLTAVSLLKSGAGLVAGGLLLWLIYWWGWGVPPWAIVQTGLNQHYTLVTLLRRYDWWLVWNLVDVLVYAGWPLVLGFGAAVGTAVAAVRARQLTAVDQLTLSLAVLLLFLDLSGSARGEVGRLWLFFMPLMTIPAAMRLADWLPGRRPMLLVTGLQLAIAISLGLAWQPVRPVIVVAQPPVTSNQSTRTTSLDATFTETIGNSTTIHLLGADLPPATAVPGEPLSLTLYWQAERGTVRPYTVFTHLVAADGSLAAQQDNWPVNGQWPPTCWQSDEIVADRVQLSLPADLPPGEYRLFTGLYDARDGTRLTTAAGPDAVHLTTVRLPAATSP